MWFGTARPTFVQRLPGRSWKQLWNSLAPPALDSWTSVGEILGMQERGRGVDNMVSLWALAGALHDWDWSCKLGASGGDCGLAVVFQVCGGSERWRFVRVSQSRKLCDRTRAKAQQCPPRPPLDSHLSQLACACACVVIAAMSGSTRRPHERSNSRLSCRPQRCKALHELS